MKKVSFCLVWVLVTVLLIYVTCTAIPKYNLYKYVTNDDFPANVFTLYLLLNSHNELFYEYPHTLDDVLFKERVYEQFGGNLDILEYGVSIRKDTIQGLFYLYLNGPNHDNANRSILNSSVLDSIYISLKSISFYEFFFKKGDILILTSDMINPCELNHLFLPVIFKKNKNDIDSLNTELKQIVYSLLRQNYGDRIDQIQPNEDHEFICYKAVRYTDSLYLFPKCQPFNGLYNTLPISLSINLELYRWAIKYDIDSFYFPLKVYPSLFYDKR